MGEPDEHSSSNSEVRNGSFTGSVQTETIRVSNNELYAYAATATGVKGLMTDRLKNAVPVVNKFLGISGSASAVTGGINDLSGNNRYEITVEYREGTAEVFDGTDWVTHTGTHIVGQTVSTY